MRATRFCLMTLGSTLGLLDGYSFEVRYSDGYQNRARVLADVGEDAYRYLRRLFSGFEPSIAIIVAGETDWDSRQPYGLPFFNDDGGQIRPGIVVMPAGSGNFWIAMGEELRASSPHEYSRLLRAYPDGRGGLDLQPFFDLVTIHELGHAFEVLGGLRLPTFWLSEIFANLALHAFIATKRPESLETLEALGTVGEGSTRLAARWRTEGYSSLEELEAHYSGGDDPMNPLNYIWYQCRWQRLAAAVFDADGEDALVRFWNCFRVEDRFGDHQATTALLASLLTTEVSATLGRAIHEWW